MSKLWRSTMMATVAVATMQAGCRDDPPAPTADTATAKSAKLKPGADPLRGKVRRISPETMKRYRIDVCYFGTAGLRHARDAYVASLGGAEPGPGKIPSFGNPPTAKDKEKPAKQPPGAGSSQPAAGATGAPKAPEQAAAGAKSPAPDGPGRMRPLPFAAHMSHTRYVRSCTIAKKLKRPASPELDQALAHYEEYVSALHKALSEAQRYYGGDKHTADEFKRGKELHGELTKAFEKLDEELQTFGKAVNTWHESLKESPEKLDVAGKKAEAVLSDARSLTVLLVGEAEKDAEELKKVQARLNKAAEELEAVGGKDNKAPHPRLLKAPLAAYLEAVDAALKELEAGKVESATVTTVAMKYVALAEASHRALARLINPRGRKRLGPGAGRLRPEGLRDMGRKSRGKPKLPPKPAPAE